MNVYVVQTLALLKGHLEGDRSGIPLVHSWRKRWSSYVAFQTARKPKKKKLRVSISHRPLPTPWSHDTYVTSVSVDKIIQEWGILRGLTPNAKPTEVVQEHAAVISLSAWKMQEHLSSPVAPSTLDALQRFRSNPGYPWQSKRCRSEKVQKAT